MGRVLLGVGKTAKIPYYMEYAAVNVYTMEELCYCLYENAFLLGPGVADKTLTAWIEKECGLPDLAGRLGAYLNMPGSLEAFVIEILEYTAYYRPEEIETMRTLLKQHEDLSPSARRALYADYLLRSKNYAAAVREYQALCEMPGGAGELGRLYHNMGAAYAGLFLFGEAASCFWQAYETAGSMESYRQYLAAERMRLPEREYVALAAQKKEAYDIAQLLEKQIEQFREEWESSFLYRQLATLSLTKQELGSGASNAVMDEMIEQIKAEYRAMALR